MAGNVLERRIPYAIGTLLNLYICTYVLRETREPELHFFFVGITFSSIAFLILSLLRYKASLHMAGIGGLTMFIAALSLHFHIDFSIILGALLLINGVVASSRLHTESHNHLELIVELGYGLLSAVHDDCLLGLISVLIRTTQLPIETSCRVV